MRVQRAVQKYAVDGEEDYCIRYYDGACTENQKRPVRSYYYVIADAKLAPSSEATSVTVDLKQPVQSGSSTTVYLSYKAKGYVKDKPFGLYDFAFETPRFSTNMDSVEVAVYADPTLFLKNGGQAKVSYAPTAMKSIGDVETNSSGVSTSAALDSSFSQSMAEETAIRKESRNLDPFDTLTVRGSYATSWWRLVWPYLALAVLGILAFVTIIVIGERRMAHLTTKLKGE